MIYKKIILFFIYSFLGWLLECAWSLIKSKELVNRGMLKGPYCPIYGFGFILLSAILSPTEPFYVLFLNTLIIIGILEYLSSYVIEKIFKMRWWDYSKYKFNLNGRVCLETIIPFSIIGSIIIKYVNPTLERIVCAQPLEFAFSYSFFLTVFIVIDMYKSYSLVLSMKKGIRPKKKDMTKSVNAKREKLL